MSKPRKPVQPPLSRTEQAALDNLIRRGARAINPAEGNRLLALWEIHLANQDQDRRVIGGLGESNRQLRQQLTDTQKALNETRERLLNAANVAADERALGRRYWAAWQSARRRAGETRAPLDHDEVERLTTALGVAESRTEDWRRAHRRQVGEVGRAAARAEAESMNAHLAAARIEAVRALAADMRTWCSPHGIATTYADRIDQALGDRP